MSTQDTDFFLDDDAPGDDSEADVMCHLKAWHRIAICVAFLASMVGCLVWLGPARERGGCSE